MRISSIMLSVSHFKCSKRLLFFNLSTLGVDKHARFLFFQVEFHDILAEPDGLHSLDCVWSTSHLCFTGGKNCCYKFLTLFMGICIALFWGCEFAIDHLRSSLDKYTSPTLLHYIRTVYTEVLRNMRQLLFCTDLRNLWSPV